MPTHVSVEVMVSVRFSVQIKYSNSRIFENSLSAGELTSPRVIQSAT